MTTKDLLGELFVPRTGPSIKRGKSEQSYETPPEFIEAVVKRFGPLSCDLAATAENKKCEAFISPELDSLQYDWNMLSGTCWLNPPFANIGPWARKCLSTHGPDILLLTPASVGANWFRDFIFMKAHVLFLSGRIQFVYSLDPYPRDLMLSVFPGGHRVPGFEIWDWRK